MDINYEQVDRCPLCKGTNDCCNSTDKSLGVCWCTEAIFPQEIFELVPPDEIRKSCICKNCLDEFIK